MKQSYLWGYQETFPEAQAINASASEIYFASMEEPGDWEGLASLELPRAHTGRRSGLIDQPTGAEALAHGP